MSFNLLKFLLAILTSFVAFEHCRPDFGVPASVPDSGSVSFSAYFLGGDMNEMFKPIMRIPPNLRSETLRKAAGNISMLALNVTEMGRNLANNFSKAASERDVPFDKLFKSLYMPIEEMQQFLSKDGPVFVKQLNQMLGNVTAYEFDMALVGLNASLMNTLQAVNNLELAINTSLEEVTSMPAILDVPNSCSQELSKAMEKFRDEVKSVGRVVDASVRSIEISNSNLDSVDFFIRAVESNFLAALSQFYSTMNDQQSSAVNKYTSAQKRYQSDFATATQRLKIFSANKTLDALSNLFAEEYTKNYYALYNRNKSDVATIYNAFNWIRMNSTNDLREAGHRFFGAVNNTAVTLMTVLLARERFSEQCNGQFSSQMIRVFPVFQTEAINCLNRERGRMSTIVDVIDRVLLLVQSSSVDFTSDIGSCSRFSSYAANEVDYLQAKACLEASLQEMDTYNRVMNTQLDFLKPVMAAEAEASHFRTRQCIMQTANGKAALMDGINTGVLKCAADGP